MKNQKTRNILIIILSLLSAIMICIAASYAYFTTDLKVNGYANVKIHLIFDRLSKNGQDKYLSTLVDSQNQPIALVGDRAEETGDYEWGHKGNPYVISNHHHLLNLSILQSIGYFDNKFLSHNIIDGALTESKKYYDKYEIPYFYISTPEANPIVIDGSKESIRPIGNADNPFVGVIEGASDPNNAVTLPNGKTSSTSALCGVKVKTNSTEIDYGFFGDVSYLGDETNIVEPPPPDPNTPPEEQDKPLPAFKGFPSKISNILFADVQVEVRDTFWDKFNQIVTGHRFDYEIGSTDPKNPHETHHLGIIAGHLEYTRFDKISVYYSNENIAAFDVHDVKANPATGNYANYASSTGFFGYMHNLNPEFNGTDITIGTGLSSAELTYGQMGGGGDQVGEQRGYIRADEMYKLYNHYAGETPGNIDQERDLILIDALNEEGKPLVKLDLTQTESTSNEKKKYYYTDNVFTFALSEKQKAASATEADLDTLENIWKKEPDQTTNIVDEIRLGKTWDKKKDGSKLYYNNYIVKITSLESTVQPGDSDEVINSKLNELDTAIAAGKTFYIGDVNGNVFKFMDLSKNENSSWFGKKSVPAISSKGELNITEQGKARLSYDNSAGEGKVNSDADVQSAITIAKTKGGKYTFTHSNGHMLGIQDTGLFVTRYELVSRTGLNKKDSNFTLLPEADGSWSFWNYEHGADNNQELGYDGSKFAAKWAFNTIKPMYIYALTGTEDNEDRVPYKYVPTDASPISLPANQYVFMPTIEHGSNGASGQKPFGIFGSGKANVPTGPEYNIVSLTELSSSHGWTNHKGEPVWSAETQQNTVSKMFNIKQAVDWTISLNILGLELGTGSQGGFTYAPVGSKLNAYVPTGSIAFNITKVPQGGAKVRFIVKMPERNILPTTQEKGGLGFNGDSNSEDYFVGIWQGKEKSTNPFISAAMFRRADALKLVELPRSQPLLSASSPTPTTVNGASSDNEYIRVKYGDQEYKTYLQGGSYLVAHEFVVNEPGIYILAASTNNMQIVYLASDGVASSGRDGRSGSPMGLVDFVYDNNSKVILTSDLQPADYKGDEDPTLYYYESNILFHFDNLTAYTNNSGVNDEFIQFYRTAQKVVGGPALIELKVNTLPNTYLLESHIGIPHDNVTITSELQRPATQ